MNQISLSALANFNSAVPWGLWVCMYIWFIGISCGSFLLVAWGNLQNQPQLKKLTRLGISLALSALSFGLLSILIDLGHMERFYKLFTSPSPSSVMAWMVWLYGVYFGLLTIALLWLKKGIPRLFLFFSFLFTLAILVAESLLFALPPGRHWHSLIFIVHFVSSSLVSAVACLIVAVNMVWVKEEREGLIKGLGKVALALVAINLIIELIDMFFMAGISHLVSWILLAGNVIAIIFLLKHNPITITLAAGIGLIDAWLSKYNSLISAQIEQPYKGFEQAYIEPRIIFGYMPSSFEILVAILLIILAGSLFYFLYKVLPLTREA